MSFTTEELERWIDRHAVDKDGHKLGTVADIYVDDSTGRPEWIAVTTGLFGSKLSFVPLLGTIDRGDDVQVAYEKSLVKDSPNIDADGQLTEEQESRLYRHYGLNYNPQGGADEDGTENEVVDLQKAGSASHNGEISPDVARERLAEIDEAAVESINLNGDDAIDLGATKSPRESQQRTN